MSAMQATKLPVRRLEHARFAHPERSVSAFGIKPGMQAADFGSGSGAYALAIAEALGSRGRVYAIDVQRDLLRRTKQEAMHRGYGNVEVIWGDVEMPGGTKLADGALDLVLISNLLFQLADKAPALAEAHRILKPGGRLVIIDWTDALAMPGAGQNKTVRFGPHRKSIVAKEEAHALVAEAGFELVREFPAGVHHWGLILKKL